MKAPTGTGKSAGFCVAALSMLQEGIRGPQVLIVTPSRPLTDQIHVMCQGLGKEMMFGGKKGVEVAKLYGANTC
jgi:superfamily II DNA/RNA helicase